tara:strand:- start:55 stop:471 length:417 start_codon:yes stop_codon:yes gene_type:complete
VVVVVLDSGAVAVRVATELQQVSVCRQHRLALPLAAVALARLTESSASMVQIPFSPVSRVPEAAVAGLKELAGARLARLVGLAAEAVVLEAAPGLEARRLHRDRGLLAALGSLLARQMMRMAVAAVLARSARLRHRGR